MGGRDSRHISSSFSAKLDAFSAATHRLHQVLFDKDEVDWIFPSELDQLGQNQSTDKKKIGINDIAIVHIDGNNMGAKFRQCHTLAQRSALSKQVNDKTLSSFRQLVQWIIDRYDVIDDALEFNSHKSGRLLPIRPIIVGGDDITFICNARIAVQATQYLMKCLAEPTPVEVGSKEMIAISSCAGIAIIPTSYPFFRGYELAEQICDRAKSVMRSFNKLQEEKTGLVQESCWLDFLFLHGETTPVLEQLLDTEYSAVAGNMHFGPYQVHVNNENATSDVYALEKLLSCTAEFNGERSVDNRNYDSRKGKGLAHNKIKELRSILQDNEHMWHLFIEQNHVLPHITGWEAYAQSLWAKDSRTGSMKTPYIDAIELMDYVLPGLE